MGSPYWLEKRAPSIDLSYTGEYFGTIHKSACAAVHREHPACYGELPRSGFVQHMPYVGRILSMVMTLEIGKVERFPSAAHLASYAGLVPRVHSSGGHTRLIGRAGRLKAKPANLASRTTPTI